MFSRRTFGLMTCVWALASPVWAAPTHSNDFGEPASAAKATRSVEVVMGDMSFNPKTIEIKAGDTVRFVLLNNGRLLHEFNLGDAAMHARHQQEMLQMQQDGMLTPTAMKEMDHSVMAKQGHAMQHDDPNSVLVAPGKSAELTWTFTHPMSLEFACNIPGHYQAGMVGQLTVGAVE